MENMTSITNNTQLSKKLFLKFFLHPKKVITTLLEQNHLYLFRNLLYFSALANGYNLMIVNMMKYSSIVKIILLIAGFFYAFAAFYIRAWLYHRLGRKLGGVGNIDHIRTAVLWGPIPYICCLFILFPFDIYQNYFNSAKLLFCIEAMKLCFFLYGFSTFAISLAVAHQYSKKRAFFNILIIESLTILFALSLKL